MKTILTYGTFDLFHIGHVRLLERARSLGDRLCVGISSDEFNEKKGKKSVIPYEHRAAIIKALRFVDEAFPEHDWDQKEIDIKKYGVDVLVMGDDWLGKFDNFKQFCDVVYLPRTDGVSSTDVKVALRTFNDEMFAELHKGLEALRAVATQFNV